MRLRMGDRSRQWLVALGVVVLFVSLFGNFYQQRMNGKSAATYNATSVRQNNEILTALHNHTDEIKSIQASQKETEALEAQVANVIDGLPAADKYLGALAAGLEAQIQSVCNAVQASCSNLPVPLPGSHTTPTSSTTVPMTTTTTTPRHHHERLRG